MENVIAEIEGTLMHTGRDLNLEEKLAGAVEPHAPHSPPSKKTSANGTSMIFRNVSRYCSI